MREDAPYQLISQPPEAEGRFPGWVAVVGMAICPLIGVFIVNLTAWRTSTKIIVSILGTILWVSVAALLIRMQHAGPTI